MFWRKLHLFKLIIPLIILIACSGIAGNLNKSNLKAIEISYDIPLVEFSNGEIHKMSGSRFIYYYEDLVLIRVPYNYTMQNQNALHGDSVIVSNDPKTVEYSETRFYNFIYRRNSNKGIMYDSLNHIPFNVDTLLRENAFKGSKFFNSNNDLLFKSLWIGDSILVEDYVPKIKKDESYNDTTRFYFKKKFINVPFSLSEEADSIKKMKLIQVNLIYNPTSNKNKEGKELPRRNLIFKLNEFKIGEENKILAVFKRFKKDTRFN